MVDFDYVRKQYDAIANDLFDSSFSINATVYIETTQIPGDSVFRGMSDALDGRIVDSIKKNIAIDLNAYYRIQVHPLGETGLSLSGNQQTSFRFGAKMEPYDRWVSCFNEGTVKINDKNIFDYADRVVMEGVEYNIKGVEPENFGNREILHIFLTKETNE